MRSYKIGLKKMLRKKYSVHIYSREAIEKAIEGFTSLGNVTVVTGPAYHNCLFMSCKYGEEKTAQEFENYMIDFMNCKG